MNRLWSADSGLENLIYVVLAIVWVIVQVVSQNAKRKKRGSAPRLDEPTSPVPPVLAPEDELRRFLRELSGETAASPAPPPPPPLPSPQPPPGRERTPALRPAYAPGSGVRSRPERRRAPPEVRAIPTPIEPLPVRQTFEPLPEPSKIVVMPERATPGLFAPVMATVPMAAPRSLGAFSLSSGRTAPVRQRSVLPRSRVALGLAVLHQVIIGEPRALAPYRR